MVEQGADEILDGADSGDVGFLVRSRIVCLGSTIEWILRADNDQSLWVSVKIDTMRPLNVSSVLLK